jgi:hypothetical protein
MTELRQKMIRAMEPNYAASYRLGYKPSTSRFQKTDMVTFAVSNTWMAVINFGGIYPRGTIYSGFSRQDDIHTFLESALFGIT